MILTLRESKAKLSALVALAAGGEEVVTPSAADRASA
jgi:hypothetical protein